MPRGRGSSLRAVRRSLGKLIPLLAVALGGAAGASLLGGQGAAVGGCADALAQPASRDVERRLDCRRACAAAAPLRAVGVRRARGGLRLAVRRVRGRRVRVDVLRATRGRLVLRGRRVASFGPRARSFRWKGRVRGRPARPGLYVVRFRTGSNVRRVAVRRRRGRFTRRPAFERTARCDGLNAFRLGSPAFGGTRRRPLTIGYRLSQPGRVGIVVKKGRRTLRRWRTRRRAPGRVFRMRLRSRVRGNVTVRLTARLPGGVVRARLVSRGL